MDEIEVKKVKVAIQESDYRVAIAKILREESSKMDISEADVIVAGGFGLGGEEAFKLLQELADCFENSTITLYNNTRFMITSRTKCYYFSQNLTLPSYCGVAALLV